MVTSILFRGPCPAMSTYSWREWAQPAGAAGGSGSSQLEEGETIPLEYEEGSNVSLTFDFTFTGFGLLQLKRNNDEVYRSDGGLPGAETGLYVSSERRDVVTFTLSLVELSDSGIYRCYATGLEKSPAYNLEVVSSEKFIGISEDFDNWDPFEIDDYVAGIEGSKLTLACRVHGGLRSNCSIRWRIEPDILPLSKKNITSCDRYQEESLLEIKEVTVNLDGSRITCESGGLNTSVFVRTKRKTIIFI
ncbi:hypothetical protein HOLleu_45041 [Holothuria leucospilota]|uniref:Ig-like domain-containing protein n=1 Tax=Holothuria leucospilota TaxID=206669 RepID=A0A9Q0YBW1_HOLLE|nr:hypothetical protein HOLleu_45041 [Holothuria leucospilota]